ncbi:MAG: hypothetical protein P4L35_07785 [Ignavibacteriaceae bacterium]|nr:hypothetical protein [Ignavibacteriaceae bacterium]
MQHVASSTMNVNGVMHSNSAGTYTITDTVTGQNLLAFDDANNLQTSSTLSRSILGTVNQLNASQLALIQSVSSDVQTLQGTVSTLQNAIGNESGSQNLASVLSIGADAGNNNIIGVNNLRANSLTVGGINMTVNGNNVVVSNLQTTEIQCSDIWLGNQNLNTRITAIENYLGNLKNFFTVLSQACEIKDNNGNNYDFSNLTQ